MKRRLNECAESVNARRRPGASDGRDRYSWQRKETEALANPRDFFTNMSAPMPLRRKLWLVARNSWTKLRTRGTCCGHEGEPGC